MDGETNSQSDAQLKGDATDQQPDVQLIDNEIDPQSSAQLEAMGFASFGQKHKRPKHHHGNSSLELAPASLPKKPPTSISPPTETARTTKSQVSYSIAEKFYLHRPRILLTNWKRDPRDNPDNSTTTPVLVMAGVLPNPIIQGVSSTIRGRLWRRGWGYLGVDILVAWSC